MSKEKSPEKSKAKAMHLRGPSGVKLILEPDSDCILKFRNIRDISDKCGKDEGEALLLVCFDGLKFVNLPIGFAVREVLDSMEPDCWYYIHHDGDIEMQGRNPMKDLNIFRLGLDGETFDRADLPHPERIIAEPETKTFTLSDKACMDANYNRLNYPLRPPK